jgi:hypothetical protein
MGGGGLGLVEGRGEEGGEGELGEEGCGGDVGGGDMWGDMGGRRVGIGGC